MLCLASCSQRNTIPVKKEGWANQSHRVLKTHRTPDKNKKHCTYPLGHYNPRDHLIEGHLGWLQEHLEN